MYYKFELLGLILKVTPFRFSEILAPSHLQKITPNGYRTDMYNPIGPLSKKRSLCKTGYRLILLAIFVHILKTVVPNRCFIIILVKLEIYFTIWTNQVSSVHA